MRGEGTGPWVGAGHFKKELYRGKALVQASRDLRFCLALGQSPSQMSCVTLAQSLNLSGFLICEMRRLNHIICKVPSIPDSVWFYDR